MARIENLEIYDEKTYLKYAIGGTAIASALGLLMLGIFTDPWQYPAGSTDPDYTLSWTQLWFMSTLIYTVFSYRFWDPVNSDQNAALLFFGRPVCNVGPGPVYAPLGLVQVAPVSSLVLQREFPAEPENIFRGEMKSEEGLPDKMKPPVRIQFRDSITEDEAKEFFGYVSEEEPGDYVVTRQAFTDDDGVEQPAKKIKFVWNVPKDGLGERVTAEPYPVVRLMIDNPALFVRNIGSDIEAFKQLEDELFNVLLNYYTRMSVAQALANTEWIAAHLKRAADRRVGKRGNTKCWGVDIQAAYVKNIHTSKGLNTAIILKAQAPFERDTVKITAEGTRDKLIKEGEGAAQAARDLEEQTLVGRAKGYVEVSKSLGRTKHGVDVQAAETARALGADGNTIIVGADGIKDLIGIAKAASAANSKGSS